MSFVKDRKSAIKSTPSVHVGVWAKKIAVVSDQLEQLRKLVFELSALRMFTLLNDKSTYSHISPFTVNNDSLQVGWLCFRYSLNIKSLNNNSKWQCLFDFKLIELWNWRENVIWSRKLQSRAISQCTFGGHNFYYDFPRLYLEMLEAVACRSQDTAGALYKQLNIPTIISLNSEIS